MLVAGDILLMERHDVLRGDGRQQPRQLGVGVGGVAVHAFIGTTANGSLAVCQFLPWQSPCWGSGSGPNGTVNGCYNGKAKAPLYVQFEICEGPHSDLDYCRKTYQTAVELCAYLIKMFPTIKPEKIFGHKEIYEQGKSDVRADPIKYWNACKSGYTMDTFRAAVKAALKAPETTTGSDVYRVQVGAFKNRVYAENYLATVLVEVPITDEDALVRYANELTGEQDETLTEATETLIKIVKED